MEEKQKYRLVTRSNFDGIVSAVLLKKLDLIDEMLFVHPKDVQEGKVDIGANDIVTNLPYVKHAHMAFDYQLDVHETITINANHALFMDAGSVSEVIYEYYGGKEVFGEVVYPMVEAANKSKSAAFTKEEILSPKGWDMLTFLSDPRTGLGRFKTFGISNYALMQKLPDLCLEKDIETVLECDDIKERVDLYKNSQENFISQLERCTVIEGDIAIIDLRDEETIYPGNRFMVYALFPDTTGSIHVMDGVRKQNTVFALGKSIFCEKHAKNIEKIVTKYYGGGHKDAGTCQVPHQDEDAVLHDLITLFKTK